MHLFLSLLCVFIVSSTAEDGPVVRIEDGEIQGTTTTNLDGAIIYSFFGIPYGKSPEKELRFKDPLPVEPWNGTFDATKMGNRCIQQGLVCSEDCLNLNVHIKELNPTKPKPVMVWIHGGGFTSGSNQQFGHEFMMIEDIIFVGINYRLGILGFLSLRNVTLGVPGNAGLKDQSLALKWVQKNIRQFGGDPNNVTIFGESAGGSSVHYQVVSEASKGLFQKAIVQSGSVLTPWATVDQQLLVNRFSKFLNLECKTEEEILERLRNYSATEFIELQNEYLKEYRLSRLASMFWLFCGFCRTILDVSTEMLIRQKGHFDHDTEDDFRSCSRLNISITAKPGKQQKQSLCIFWGMTTALGPVIENPNDSPFITERGLDILKSGKYNTVPILMGYCSNEGLLFETMKRVAMVNNTALGGQEFHMGVINSLGMNLQVNDSLRSHIERELIDIYFNGTNAGNKYLLSSDWMFIRGVLRSAAIQADISPNPVYLYRMTLDAGRNLLKRTYHLDDFPGVSHADDLGYLFPMEGLAMGEKEEQYVRRFVKLWTNFAKFGNPTPNVTDFGIEWKPLDEENQYFMDIGEELTLKSKPEPERMAFWQEISPDGYSLL